MRLAIIIPVLNEAESLPTLIAEIETTLGGTDIDHKVFVVDDGSIDSSASRAAELGATVLRSTRNIGKSAALQAGFNATKAYDAVVTMDGDLQDDPSEIPRLLSYLSEYDVVNAWKANRQDSKSILAQSRMFGAFVRSMTDLNLRDINSGFKAYRRRVLDSIELTGDQHRLLPLLAFNAGFSVTEIEVNHRPRAHGQSKFGPSRAFRGPMDLFTVLFLSKYGQRPLHFLGGAGILTGIVGFAIALYLTGLKVFSGESIGDRPLLLLSVLLILTGIQLFVSGLIGEMILRSRRGRQPSPFREFEANDEDGKVDSEPIRPPEDTRSSSGG